LYQLLTYPRNLEASLPGQKVDGLLVYPAVQSGFLSDLRLSSHAVRICTINLASEWKEVAEWMRKIAVMNIGELN
jgi:5-methylcytosine-specific restriction enzyme subunit McrC